ncbi:MULTISPECIES: DUF5689 domain-containing protein [unclassified Flavobacterium]|jgi:hypothetical protein|uniref:DUF5689 domain-containing protein n=1 Tax=unclassified Flavobacterium TaxID=196869 RepID=UPI0025BDCEE3|nr:MULTISPECIES: DUF5689 domain-containing protein [unclassified Flavobacterium]
MKNKIKNIFIITVSIALFSSCVKDTFNTPIQDVCINPGLTKTKEVANIYAAATTITATYTADDIVEAYVISSDEGGNFYKSMYFQPLDGSKGFNLSVDEVNAYTKNLQPGKKVFLKLKGLAFANPSSFGRGLIFGAPPTEQYAVDRLSGLTYKNYLIPSCDVISEDAIVKHLTISQALSNKYLNTLVEIDDVQFKTDCTTYSKKDFDTSLKITNGKTTLDVRTSRYANFAGYPVPSGRGKIRGVLTRYGSTYQIILRTERDVNLINPRIQTPYLPKTGTSLQYLGVFTENFESYATTTTGANFPKYINDAAVGYKYWDVVLFSSNKYIQVSAYNNGCTKAYFVVPVDMTAANSLSFKTKDGYNDGDPLKVYYSTDYVPGNNVSQATLVDITGKFKISTGNTSGYGSSFISSGTYPIPTSLTGNGYFIFEYDGTTGTTTTIQIDDITVN